MDIINPATGATYALLAAGDEADVQLAYTAAKNASQGWAQTPLATRQAILEKIAMIIEDRMEELAQAEMQDSGKPIALARRLDIPRAASNFAFFAAAASQLASESHYMPGQAINYTLRQPIGVVGCISPWNLPLYLFTWKIAPALAAGNAPGVTPPARIAIDDRDVAADVIAFEQRRPHVAGPVGLGVVGRGGEHAAADAHAFQVVDRFGKHGVARRRNAVGGCCHFLAGSHAKLVIDPTMTRIPQPAVTVLSRYENVGRTDGTLKILSAPRIDLANRHLNS